MPNLATTPRDTASPKLRSLLVVQLPGEDPRDSLVLAAAAAFSGLGCDGEPLGKPESIQDLEDRDGELDEDHPFHEWADPRRSVRRFAIETGLSWESTSQAISRLRKRDLLTHDGQVSANDIRARNRTQGRVWLKYSRELRVFGMPYRAKALTAWLLNLKVPSVGEQTTTWCIPRLAKLLGWTERQVEVALAKAKAEGWVQRQRVGNRWHTTAGCFPRPQRNRPGLLDTQQGVGADHLIRTPKSAGSTSRSVGVEVPESAGSVPESVGAAPKSVGSVPESVGVSSRNPYPMYKTAEDVVQDLVKDAVQDHVEETQASTPSLPLQEREREDGDDPAVVRWEEIEQQETEAEEALQSWSNWWTHLRDVSRKLESADASHDALHDVLLAAGVFVWPGAGPGLKRGVRRLRQDLAALLAQQGTTPSLALEALVTIGKQLEGQAKEPRNAAAAFTTSVDPAQKAKRLQRGDAENISRAVGRDAIDRIVQPQRRPIGSDAVPADWKADLVESQQRQQQLRGLVGDLSTAKEQKAKLTSDVDRERHRQATTRALANRQWSDETIRQRLALFSGLADQGQQIGLDGWVKEARAAGWTDAEIEEAKGKRSVTA